MAIHHRLLDAAEVILLPQSLDGYDVAAVELKHKRDTGIDGVIGELGGR